MDLKKDINNLTFDDMKPITVSFKRNENDFELYKWILKHSNYSGFIKDYLKMIKDNENNNSQTKTGNEQVNLIDMDF